MATPGGGKKGKKKKGQTLSLNAFLGDSPSTPAPAPRPKTDWADDSDDLGAIELAEEYGGPAKPSIDMSKLPSAPRASRGLDVDFNKLPSKPPYTAFLGNLPFDTTEEEIEQLFRGLRVENIRFPQDQGRMKGFGYAEFFDLEQLKQALALSGEKIRNRQVRIDIAEQAGKDGRDGGGGFSRGGFSQADGDGDWRRGGDDGPPPQRYDDRRGGPGGFDRRGPRDDMDGRPPRPMGQADQDDCWRKDNPSTGPPSTNGWGNRRDDGGGWGRRPGGGFDDRGPPRGGFDDRGPPRGGFDDRGPPRGGFDDRGPPRGGFDDRGPRDDGGSWRNDRGPPPRDGFRDDRGPRDGFRDDRGPPRDGFRDDRGPPRDGFRDDRGPPRDGFRDDRGPPRDGFRDDRGPPRDGYRDDRGPPRDGFRDDRGPPRDGYRDDRGFRDDRGPPRDGGFRDNRGPPRDGYRDDRGPRDGGFRRDDRGYSRGYDDRGPPRDDRWRNDRDPPQDRRGAPDIVPEGPKERPKLNLQPRTAEATEAAKTPTSSIFGGARPVDTAAKERQIEDKMAKSPNRENRDRNRENRDRRDGEKDYRSPPRESDKREEASDNTAENWRDESLRQDDKSRSTRPDIIPDSEKGGRSSGVSSGGSRGRGRGRGRGNDRGKKNVDGGPIVPPKYEEPPKVVFGQSSKFALLADEDEEGEGHSDSNDEASTEEVKTS